MNEVNIKSDKDIFEKKFYTKVRALVNIVILNFVICIVFPGLVSFLDNTFSEDKLLVKVEAGSNSELKKWRIEYLEQKQNDDKHKQTIKNLEIEIRDINDTNSDYRIKKYNQLETIKSKHDEEYEVVTFMAFTENQNIYIWWLLTTCLFFVISINPIQEKSSLRRILLHKKNFIYSLWMWIVFYGIYFLRNVVFNSHDLGRKVFAYSHPDISIYSSITQAIVIFWFCWLSSSLIRTYIQYGADINVPEDDIEKAINNGKEDYFITNSRETTTEYEKWILNSLIVGVGFLIFLSIYRKLIFDQHDNRYIPSAAAMFIIWCLCWYSITQPLIKRLTRLELIKSNILSKSIKNKDEYSNYDNFLKENTFLGKQSLFITLLISLFTIISSLLKIF